MPRFLARFSRARLAAAAVVLALLATTPFATAELIEEHGESVLTAALRDGGYVIYLRHAKRYSGVKEKLSEASALSDFTDCAGQRNLTPKGREQAIGIGKVFRENAIPVGQVYALPLCRTRQTAVLAFGRVILGTQFYNVDDVKRLLATEPPRGSNTILVASDSQLAQIDGIRLGFGEAAVFRPDGAGGFVLAGVLDGDDLTE